jgi:hypothetical protein
MDIEFNSKHPGQEEEHGCDIELVCEARDDASTPDTWYWLSIFERYRTKHGPFATDDEARADALKEGPKLWPAD